ncbi:MULTISPECIES: RNA-guided endonuclease InsQ/TnpB family protein [Streptomyces violaceusniger group]|uniref:Transposase n=1 Tax=Streptomyces rhizosphaericus TaxID=114699 RepID=A0ABP4D1V7_9ACTN|nr:MULTISPECIES: RNA-guided endonuclease TnpB family protein [Streptomyces violaceusniger group]
MATHVKRAYRYRFYPTGAQAVELSRTFGCVRKVYNMALAARTEAWTLRQERVSYNATSAMLTAWRKTGELAFLNDVSSVPLQQALRHLRAAFTAFFAQRSKYPLFTSRKRSRKSAEYTSSAFRFREGKLTLAKMDQPLDVARVYARIADRRRDHLHKLTTRLVRENQTLVIEDLAVRNMLSNGKLSRAISDAAWSQFRSMPEYKAAWYGREVIAVDRWFPSSKLCSVCGTLQGKMPLGVRTWTCDCGTTHDRDVNAARNPLAAGLAVSACGAGVRPQRESSRTGQSVTKQEALRREPQESPSFRLREGGSQR